MPTLSEYQFAIMLAEKARQFGEGDGFGVASEDPVTPPITVKVTAAGASHEVTITGTG